MTNLKFITSLVLIISLTFTSCQDEIDTISGQDPDTNNATSETAWNLKRTSMYDGSFDDDLDGSPSTSLVLPVVATINGLQINILNQLDLNVVFDLLGLISNNVIKLQFPLTVKLSNYTEVVVNTQIEYNAIISEYEALEAEGKGAINCLNVDLPITILTYNLTLEQTASVVVETEQQLYTYINNMDNTQLFSVNYPITAALSNNTTVTLNSDLELENSINDCLGF